MRKWTDNDERLLQEQVNDELIDIAHVSLGALSPEDRDELLSTRRQRMMAELRRESPCSSD